MALAQAVRRPQRWERPFAEQRLSDPEIDRVLAMAPFDVIDPAGFSAQVSLRGLIANDARILELGPGDVVCQAGDYGTSAFFVLEGSLRALLPSPGEPPEAVLTRSPSSHRGVLRALRGLWRGAAAPEARDSPGVEAESLRSRHRTRRGAVLVHDLERVLDERRTAEIGRGEFLGELAALGRTPRAVTVVADRPTQLLEIRWQGLRDIYRRAPAIRERIDDQFRQAALDNQLRKSRLLAHLDDAAFAAVAASTSFESFGNREWSGTYQQLAEQDPRQRLRDEPLIAAEGDYPNGLILIRSGFARLSRNFGSGERTHSYLSKGQAYGLDEILEAARTGDPAPLQFSLRAIGYVDTLLIPTRTLEQWVLPSLPADFATESPAGSIPLVAAADEAFELRTESLESLVEHRIMNGTAAMLIDLDRCTRCDDCVRACAATHDGNPRFVRHGAQIGRFMVANACMHCVDPVCMIGCPTGAIFRHSQSGQVLIDDPTCIGCATCANNCPYDNIRMVETRARDASPLLDGETGEPILKATKCDLCHEQRVSPACQRACPHDALRRVDVSDPRVLEELLRQ